MLFVLSLILIFFLPYFTLEYLSGDVGCTAGWWYIILWFVSIAY